MDASILVPVVAIVFGTGIPLSRIWTEYLRDKALIEKGLYQPKPLDPPGWELLLAGSIVTGIGIALIISAFVFNIDKATIGIPGLISLFIGIPLIVVYSVTREKKAMPKN